MNFPYVDYHAVTEEAKSIVCDRDAKGRNDAVPFYEQHTLESTMHEFKRRHDRIAGAVKAGHLSVAREDALDLANYAVFFAMLIDHQYTTKEATSCQPSPYSDIKSTVPNG